MKKGFTLMELLIVIAIIAILAVTFIPNAMKAPARARDVARINHITQIRNTVELYYQSKGVLPVSADGVCFTEALKTTLEMPAYYTDQTKEGSCSAADGKSQMYYYKAVANGDYYVVGAKMENADSGNTTATLAAGPVGVDNGVNLTNIASPEDAQMLIQQKPLPAGDTYFVLVGPS